LFGILLGVICVALSFAQRSLLFPFSLFVLGSERVLPSVVQLGLCRNLV
jgi:hypothetical protein